MVSHLSRALCAVALITLVVFSGCDDGSATVGGVLENPSVVQSFEPIDAELEGSAQVRPGVSTTSPSTSRAVTPGGGVSAAVGPQAPEFITDEILISFREGVSDIECREHIRGFGHTVERRFRHERNPSSRLNRLYLVRVPPGVGVERALAATRRDPAVEYAQPNYIYHALSQPNDFYYYLQWALENVGGNIPYTQWGMPGPAEWLVDADMDAEAARQSIQGWTFEPVVVGVVDSGIDLAHPDLQAHLWTNPGEISGNNQDDDGNGFIDDIHGWDFESDDDDPLDYNGHGTHVAGFIGAVTDNAMGMSGIAPNAVLMALQFLDSEGSGGTADAIDAILYGVDNGARVLNNSWGGGYWDQALNDAIQAAYDAGTLFVAAAGNTSNNNDLLAHYPSSYTLDNVVSVAASNPWGGLADFSSYGFTSVDLAAPGDEILSTTRAALGDGVPDAAYQLGFPSGYNSYRRWSGTSMASPAVAGAAVLLYGYGAEIWPNTWHSMTPSEQMLAVRERLFERAERWPTFGGLMVTGGHLNLANLFETDTTPPDSVGTSLQRAMAAPAFLTLRCTATGDDGTTGRANYYDVRYQQGATIDWDTATRLPDVWTPGEPGSVDTFNIMNLQPATEYTVAVRVVDNVGNQSDIAELTTMTAAVTVFFADDMESGEGDWSSSTWTLDTEHANSPVTSWTDSAGGLYPNRSTRELLSPEIATDGSPVTLAFSHRYDIERNYDYGYVQARAKNGGSWGTWTEVVQYTGAGTTWQPVTVNLPVTGDFVQLNFKLVSDSSVQADGWTVDDVFVFGGAGETTEVVHFEDDFETEDGQSSDCSNWDLEGDWDCESMMLSDSPGSDYPTNYRASATLAEPISFQGVQEVEVSFRFGPCNLEYSYDYVWFEYSLDGTNWRLIEEYTGYWNSTRLHNLSFLAGMPAVQFRFTLLSDYSGEEDGVHIDDFVVNVIESAATCVDDTECDDGFFCNGAETCNVSTGDCENGVPFNCDDGVSCTVDACNEGTDSCDNAPTDSLCSNGTFCDGAETCDAVLDCQVGTSVNCDDGVICTVDACNEGTDSCDNVPTDSLCSNGAYCDGLETCDAVLDCQVGTAVDCDDGVICTVDVCNEGTDSCDNVPDDGACDNGAFCDGAELCDPVLGCQLGSDPCPTNVCDEGADGCTDCLDDGDCDDGLYCTGVEACVAGVCQAGTPVSCDDGVSCTVDACNEGADSCDNAPDDALCDNGVFCDGAETCDAVWDCQVGTPVNCDDGVNCTVDACNEGTDSCDNVPDDGACDNGAFCDGAETCDEVSDCQAGTSVDCGDGVSCTADSCNEVTDSCENAPDDGLCDNGLYCDGVETCDAVSDCQVGTPVNCEDSVSCTIDACNEVTDSCENAPDDGLCDDGDACTFDACDVVLGCQYQDDPECPSTVCGNGVCEGDGEDCSTCAQDCACLGRACRKGCCGDGICSRWESSSSCPVDCN